MKSVATVMNSFCLVLGIAALTGGAVGCGGSQKKPDEMTANVDMSGGRDSDSGNAEGLQTVHFPYDSFTLTGESKATLDANVQILKDKSSLQIQVEGHCDDRGGIQYNLALGEKRANSVRKYLVDKGISGDRVTTISFGEERPLSQGSSEEAWSKNRRANFVVTSR